MVAREKSGVFQILMVEDNSADAKLISLLFKKCKTPFSLDVVTDGQQAIQYLLKEGAFGTKPRPHLIILDLNLPKKNGREVLQEIKTHPEFRRIPVIVLTTSNTDHDIKQVYDLNANAFVSKPSELSDLSATIENIEAFWMKTAELSREDVRP